MIVIVGTKYRGSLLEGAVSQDQYCRKCGQFTAHKTYAVRPWLTLFFIPIFPVGKVRHELRCTKHS